MGNETPKQLVNYIAPGAPATRRPATGDEPFLRPEIGFTPAWYHHAVGVDFGERWHTEPAYRRDAVIAMAHELKRRFSAVNVGWIDDADEPADLLTGTFGACCVAAIYGLRIVYAETGWPTTEHHYLTPPEVDTLEPPDLDANPFFADLMAQVEWIARRNGQVHGYVNWQGVLNNAYRLCGEDLFADMLLEPARAQHLFDCVAQTMTDAATRLYERQRNTGVDVRHFTISNCLVNMVSPETYAEMLLPFDRRFAETFGVLGVHNCAWNADPYVPHYARLPDVGYIDMGLDSDLAAARSAFPRARRAVMVTPMDLTHKDLAELGRDLERCARDYGPCDVVFADIDTDTPDDRVLSVVEACAEISRQFD